MWNYIQHFITISKHKWIVCKLCFGCGLYKQGMLHDLSKYQWVEFYVGKYFQGNRSPIDKEKEIKGFSKAWLHHKGKNKHHWEYWLDNGPHGVKALEMPLCYVIEMFCDRNAACIIYLKDAYCNTSAYDYFMQGYDRIVMHDTSKKLLQSLLSYEANNGLYACQRYIRSLIKKSRS